MARGWALPLFEHVRNPLHADNPLAVHLQDCVVGNRGRRFRASVALEGAVLRFAVDRERFDHFPDDAGQVALEIGGVLASDHGVGDKREIVADKHAAAEADADGKALVMAVAQPDRILVDRCRGS